VQKCLIDAEHLERSDDSLLPPRVSFTLNAHYQQKGFIGPTIFATSVTARLQRSRHSSLPTSVVQGEKKTAQAPKQGRADTFGAWKMGSTDGLAQHGGDSVMIPEIGPARADPPCRDSEGFVTYLLMSEVPGIHSRMPGVTLRDRMGWRGLPLGLSWHEMRFVVFRIPLVSCPPSLHKPTTMHRGDIGGRYGLKTDS
jgi:hypothetical protein